MKRYVKEFANDRKQQLQKNDLIPQNLKKERLNTIDAIVAMCELGKITELEAVRFLAVEYGEFRKEALKWS